MRTNLSIVVDSGEAVEVPLEARVLVSSSGEGKSSPTVNVVHTLRRKNKRDVSDERQKRSRGGGTNGDLLVSVVVVDLGGGEGLGGVSSSLVVEDLKITQEGRGKVSRN